MPTKKSKYEKNVFYFFTITCLNWLPLFEATNCYDKIYNWFEILKSFGIKTVSYVIMPNHLHSIIYYPENAKINSNKNENTPMSSSYSLPGQVLCRGIPDTKSLIKKSVNQIIGTGKRFLAYEIVKRLKSINEKSILNLLSESVCEKERKKGKLHQVFQPSFDLKAIETKKYLLQKINYIHKNPVAKKWKLVEDYREYKYSSAGFYELENYEGYKVEHYLEIR